MDNRGIFSKVVCSPVQVRSALADYRPVRCWWRAVLWLHGKPQDPRLSDIERLQCIAEGFRFYAWLYGFLALVFLTAAAAIAILDVPSGSAAFWSSGSLMAAIYLWLVSGLGYAGATAYQSKEPQGVTSLISFMVMIIAFLSLFLSTCSIVAHQLRLLSTWINLAAAGTLFVFGVGSYLIEIMYLATDGSVTNKWVDG